MRIVWVINRAKIVSVGATFREDMWVYGKGNAGIRRDDVTTEWLDRHGYGSLGAATRQLKNHPCGSGAYVESWKTPDSVLRYKIYRCYEIVIVDPEGNQVGETDYCYGTRKDAEIAAEHHLRMTKMEEGLK